MSLSPEPRRYPNGQPDLHDPAWHEEDGHGGCTTCLFSVPYTDDEQIRQNWPCAVVREAEAADAPLREALERLADRYADDWGIGAEESAEYVAARATLTATPAPDPLDRPTASVDVEALRRAYCLTKHGGQHAECDSYTITGILDHYRILTARAAATEDEKHFFPFTHDHP